MVFETTNAEATILLGERLAKFLKPGAVVAFYGELGSGKTTMIKGFARGLGVKEMVKSPSFVIVTEYQGRMPVYHIDLYRINLPEEFTEIGIDSYIGGDGVCLIEWAEKAEGLLPEKTVRIRIWVLPKGRRLEIAGLAPEVAEELK
ncbi:MAG: tRNA (adenosine(37)-N6)-threonylcarbamoyltransferase complex ATPase subunit type 1 TsaE [candidate division WOR-3 bacterium]